MKKYNKILFFVTLLLMPLNIFAVGITVTGAGDSPISHGGSTSSSSGGTYGAAINQSIGFRATRYEYDENDPNKAKIIKTRYYLRARYLHATGWDIYLTASNPEKGVLEYQTTNFVSTCSEAEYGQTYTNINTARVILTDSNCNKNGDDSTSKFVAFFEPSNCNVGEQSNGAWGTPHQINATNCVFAVGPGWSPKGANKDCQYGCDMGITFQAANLVGYLNSNLDLDSSPKPNTLLYNMITYLYGETPENIDEIEVKNQYLLIEPLLKLEYNGSAQIMTAKDMYLYSYRSGHSYSSPVAYNPGNPTWFASAMFTVHANKQDIIDPGYQFYINNGLNTSLGAATCWRNGIGAIYINMEELGTTKTCAPDQCCFDKVSANTYKYDSTNATSGDYHQWNKYKLKNPNNSTFVTTVNSQKQIKDTYLDNHQFGEPDSTFEKCGCDQTDPDMCCYAYDGTKYTYKPELNASTADKYNYYQFIDAATGKPAPNDTRPGEFKSCGCDPETQCCYDSAGTYQASYQGTGYGVSGRYSKDGGVLMPCFCASSSSSNGSCGGNKATKKQVNAGDNQLACLANFDSSGTSRSNVPGAYYNNEVGCEFEYEVSYPEPNPKLPAESGKKLQLVTGPLVTVKVTRKCVSTNKSKLEALTAKPTINFSSTKFKYDDQSMLGLTSAQTFDLYTRDDKTESGKSFEYQTEKVGTTINEGDYFLREYTYTYNYYIPYLEYDSTEGIAKILSTERPEENNEFWINKLPIPYNAKSKNGNYTRYISMNVKQNGSNNLSYSDGGITCNYNVTDANKVKFFYRVIDLDNMNKLGRTLGYNWSDTRGQTVKTAVEKTGNYANLTNGNNGIFSFTLDPATMVMIRNYNKKESQGNHGGYNDGDRLTETKEGVNGCHYHWYSPFLYCLYYGNDGTNCDISTSVDVSGCSVKFKSNDNLKNTFDNYTSISKPNGGGFDQYDFETNMGNLIKKQHNLG